MERITGKAIVITGASSGIGEATARLLAQRGARVLLTARRMKKLKDIQQDLASSEHAVEICLLDVTDRQAVETAKSYAMDRFGAIDVWINNAGLMPLSYLDKLQVDEWDRMVDVNIKGVLYGIAAALPVMIAQNSGHIINISSVAGHKVGMGGAVYSGTKFAVRAITEGIRMELSGHKHIRATIISPGLVETELLTTITDQDALNALSARVSGPPMSSVDVANAIAYAIEQPENVSVNEIILRPTEQLN